jgi:ribulose 1,5-bisphosphate synthetase/thiazole synthase
VASSSSLNGNNNHDNSLLLDVAICGAGPGGLLLAAALAKLGCQVGVVDPAVAE